MGVTSFCIVLPETCARQGWQIAVRLQKIVAQQRFATPAGSLSLTVSIGFSSLAQDTAAQDKHGKTFWTGRDQALYRAKRAGRNRVCGEERVEIGDWKLEIRDSGDAGCLAHDDPAVDTQVGHYVDI